ncbi:MAG: zinc ABC transporter substrate-binding protein [Pseudomonadota bacterium]
MRKIFALLAILLFGTQISYADDGKIHIVTSIKPLHSIVANIVGDKADLTLLVGKRMSPHGFILKPSHVRALKKADHVFYIHSLLEEFLRKLEMNNGKGDKFQPLLNIPGIKFHKVRRGIVWEDDDDHIIPDANNRDKRISLDDYSKDLHIWLDVGNAVTLADYVASFLSERHPQYARFFQENAEKLSAKIAALDTSLRDILQGKADIPFIVFHDAYQYFEKNYNLNAAGSIKYDPNENSSIKRLKAIRQRLHADNIRCVFSEPQFPLKNVEKVIEGTEARIFEIDPHGSRLSPGKDHYFEMMNLLGKNFKACLSQ